MSEISEKRNIVLGISGSIAAYKGAELARLLVSRGYSVRAVITEAGQKFITPHTLQAVTGNPVTTGFWDETETAHIGHIQLADWANAVVVAPASANLMAKYAAGIADSPILAALLATKAPVLIAPAMNVNMFDHPATIENIKTLRARGVRFVDPEEGALACGWNGMGRLANPQEIFFHIRRTVSEGDYGGKRILIVSGPTREQIDPVRYVSNRSSGKMGLALAVESYCRGAEVALIHGPIPVEVPSLVKRVAITSAKEMHEAVLKEVFSSNRPPDMIVMSAAVADYRPKTAAEAKLKRAEKGLSIDLVPNPDIISDLSKRRGKEKRPVLIGFAVETGEVEDLLTEVRRKLKVKGVDMIVGNLAQDSFELETNRVWIVDRDGKQEEVATTFKSRVANKILDAALRL